jgi:chemotaxis protein MotB
MLSSFATMEEAKIMRFVRSFAAAVSVFPGGRKFDSGKVVLPESEDIVEDSSELARVFEEFQAMVAEHHLENEVTFNYCLEGLVMRLADHAVYDSGVAELSPEAMPLLAKIGEIIAKTNYSIRIEGHTDNLPIHTEKFPSNWELSATRAVNVLRYLSEMHQISQERLSAVGFAEYRPLMPNDSVEHRAKNRRVEIIFIK